MDGTIPTSDWMDAATAIDYITQGVRTPKGRRILSPRYLRREVKGGRLRAAKVGGRGQLLFKRAWLDTWLEDRSSQPLAQPVRRRA